MLGPEEVAGEITRYRGEGASLLPSVISATDGSPQSRRWEVCEGITAHCPNYNWAQG